MAGAVRGFRGLEKGTEETLWASSGRSVTGSLPAAWVGVNSLVLSERPGRASQTADLVASSAAL